MVGPDKYRGGRIAAMAREINRECHGAAVVCLSHVGDRELGALYRGAALVIAVSDSEAFGLPPFEAYLLGTPAVMRRTALVTEIYGENVFTVCDPVTPNSIADAMLMGLSDHGSRASIAEAGRLAGQTHDYSSALQQIVHLAERVSRRRPVVAGDNAN